MTITEYGTWLTYRTLPLVAAGMGGVMTSFGWRVAGFVLLLVAVYAQDLLISWEANKDA